MRIVRALAAGLFVLAPLAHCGSDDPAASPEGGDGGAVDGPSVAPDATTPDGAGLPTDPNEPNDVTPTVVALTPSADGEQGSATGVVATKGDVDRFAVNVASGDRVLYVRVTAPALDGGAAPAMRLTYELRAPDGVTVLAAGDAPTNAAIDLGTARHVVASGSYTLTVSARANDGTPAGDPRLAYTIDVRVLPVADPLEPNDALASSPVRELQAAGGAASFSGRVGWVGDADWARVVVSASLAPMVLSYKLVPKSSGRFPRLPGPNGLRLRVLTPVTKGADVAAWRTACKSDVAACPRALDPAHPAWQAAADAACDLPDVPQCLRALRLEHAPHSSLANVSGTVALPPHASALPIAFVVDDADGDGADDVPYTLEVRLEDDPDEAARYNAGVEVPTAVTLAAAPAVTTLTGSLSYGFGVRADLDPALPSAARGPEDYDAEPSDVDTFVVQLPAGGGLGADDRTWNLRWSVASEGVAVAAHDLAIDATFCDGDATMGGGACTPVAPVRLTAPGVVVPWPKKPAGAAVPTFVETTSSAGSLDAGTLLSTTTATSHPEACLCFEPRFVRGGSMTLRVRAADRRSYARSTYSIETSYGAYPANAACPAPALVGEVWQPGCRYTK